jgi:hypothetical protein
MITFEHTDFQPLLHALKGENTSQIPRVSFYFLLALFSATLSSCSLDALRGIRRRGRRIVIVVEFGRDGRKRRIVSLPGRSPQLLCRYRVVQTG